MTGEVWIVLHSGQGQMPLLDYLYRMFLHLVAFAVIALSARFGADIFAVLAEAAKSEPDAEKQKP